MDEARYSQILKTECTARGARLRDEHKEINSIQMYMTDKGYLIGYNTCLGKFVTVSARRSAIAYKQSKQGPCERAIARRVLRHSHLKKRFNI